MATASLISHTGTSATFGRSPALSAPVYYRSGYHSAGQGKTASTILADQGDFVTVVSDVPYVDRSRRSTRSDRPVKGSRSMHKTTLVIPNQNYTDYDTTLKRVSLKSISIYFRYGSREPDKPTYFFCFVWLYLLVCLVVCLFVCFSCFFVFVFVCVGGGGIL